MKKGERRQRNALEWLDGMAMRQMAAGNRNWGLKILGFRLVRGLVCACDGCLAVALRWLPAGRGCLGCSWAPAIEKMLAFLGQLRATGELRGLIGPQEIPCYARAPASAYWTLRLTEESKNEARGISSSGSVPDIGRHPGSPAISTKHHWPEALLDRPTEAGWQTTSAS